jgi:hypothetical protein
LNAATTPLQLFLFQTLSTLEPSLQAAIGQQEDCALSVLN